MRESLVFHNRRLSLFIIGLAWLGQYVFVYGQTTSTGLHLQIVTGSKPTDLERFAAQELSGQLGKLFGANAAITTVAAIDDTAQVIIAEQSRLREFVKLQLELPKLAPQDHALKSAKIGNRPVLVVTGGSPAATMWAAYELGWQFGVRYFLFGDLYPANPSEFRVQGFDLVIRPHYPQRIWVPFSPTLAGSTSWGFDEHKKILGQLAKLKFNGIHAQDGDLTRYVLEEQAIVVSGDTQGRTVFSGAKLFGNPDLLNAADSNQRRAAAESLVGKVVVEAKRLGMSTEGIGGSAPQSATVPVASPMPVPSLLPTSRIDFALQATGAEQFQYCINPNDAAPEAIFLGRKGFNSALTPEQFHKDLLDPVCGEGVDSRVSKALSLCAQATELIVQHDPNLGVQSIDKWTKVFAADEPVPAWWLTVRDHYLNAMNEMYRANTRAREGGRQYTLYFARRFEFGFEYLNALEAVRKAGIAQRANKQEEAIAELEKALDSITGACNAMAAVARNNSDRGVIALMNEYAYRPVTKLLEAADAQ